LQSAIINTLGDLFRHVYTFLEDVKDSKQKENKMSQGETSSSSTTREDRSSMYRCYYEYFFDFIIISFQSSSISGRFLGHDGGVYGNWSQFRRTYWSSRFGRYHGGQGWRDGGRQQGQE
jgi:hypothetical protein